MLDRYHDAGEALYQAATTKARLEALLQKKPALEAQLVSERARTAGRRYTLEGPNASQAAASLQALVRRQLEAGGASVRSLALLPVIKEEGFERLTARVDAGLTSDRLLDSLAGIEALASPFLSIEALEIRGMEGVNRGNANPANVQLALRLDIAGYWRAP
jgi:hypothetical protein